MNLDTIAQSLKERADALGLRHEALTRHVRHEDDRPRDDAEAATWRGQDEVWEALDEATEAERQSILRALDRLEAGTFGLCTRCGEVIAPARLSARPEASLCVGCAAAVEGA